MKFKIGDTVKLKKGACQYMKESGQWAQYMNGIDDGMEAQIVREVQIKRICPAHSQPLTKCMLDVEIEGVESPRTVRLDPVVLERP